MTQATKSAPTAAGKKAAEATANLKKALEAKKATEKDGQAWNGPDNQTAGTGLASHPNTGIAPSGALHAEGMRAAISRSTGNR